MVRSGMPLPSLLHLFGALLILSPELLLGIPEPFTDLPLTDPGVMKALAFAVEQYNQDRDDSPNYFKMLRILKAQSQPIGREEYRFTMDLVKTACRKTDWKRTYEVIQTCLILPGNPEKPNCYFIVRFSHPLNEMVLGTTDCI